MSGEALRSRSALSKAIRKAERSIKRILRGTPAYWALYPSWWLSLCYSSKAIQARCHLTAIPNPGAGIGHQLANWIAGRWFASRFELCFAHTPFPDPSWEALLNLEAGDASAIELRRTGIRTLRLPGFDEDNPSEVQRVLKIIHRNSRKPTLFVLEQDQGYRDQFGVREILRAKYWNSPKLDSIPSSFPSDRFNLVIHVRRGDIMSGVAKNNPNHLMRYQSADYFERILGELVKEFEGAVIKPILIHVFSQGNKDEFRAFERFGEIKYHLETGPRESFVQMSLADLLVISKSSFSYKPALLSRGLVVSPRLFWHGYPDSPDWIIAEEDGTLSEDSRKRLGIALMRIPV
ncbi:MAG: hypothetical protein RL173_868 [Fibrobacterota bacterium]|jgi:hypothetical protein